MFSTRYTYSYATSYFKWQLFFILLWSQ